MMTRGGFLRTAASIGMAPVLAPAMARANETALHVEDVVWDEEFDVVVVGAGLAGMAASAALATECEATSCLLLEKSNSESGGGNTPFSSGGVTWTDDAERFLEYLKGLRGKYDATPDDVLIAFAKGTADIRSWVLELGAVEEDIKWGNLDGRGRGEYPEIAGGDSVRSLMYKKDKETSTFSHIQQLFCSVLKQHADVVKQKVSCPVTALVQDPSTRRVLGCVYEEAGESVYVRATHGVIMCCGGFESDPTMRQDYLSAPDAHPVAAACNTGDGHRMCMRAGADLWHMHSGAGFWGNAVSLDGSSFCAYRKVGKEQGITVGTNGRRFYMDYDMTVHGWPGPDEVVDLSRDVGSRHGHQQFGGEWSLLPLPSTTWFIYDVAHAADAYVGGSGDAVADGYAVQADTIEGLANLIDVPENELVRTVDQWNQYCESGADLSFFRPVTTLNSITEPPFTAMRCCCELLNTDGGPRRSAKAEVMDVDGEPIPGLYSAGEFGSIWSDLYQGSCNLGECIVFGRIAAHSCMGE